MKKIIITCILLALSISTEAQSWWNTKKVRGNGRTTTETRKTATYEGINTGGSFDVLLVKGKEGNITIKGEENLIPYIQTTVEKGVLKIEIKKGTNMQTTRKMLVTVPYQDIEKVSLSGSGNFTSNTTINAKKFATKVTGSGSMKLDVDSDEINATLTGSGFISIRGTSELLTCRIAGSGDINAYDLATKTTIAKVTGSGNIKTSVSDKITAKVTGSGNIYYKGNPDKIDAKSAGSGAIIDRN